MPRPAKVLTLHRYFIAADRMKHHFDRYIRQHRFDESVVDSKEWPIIFSLMSVWYGTLYVVVEGWRRLRLSNTDVDRYLADHDLVRSLESARNGAFHFKPKYWDESHRDFIVRGESSAQWARGLHHAFSQFFLDWYKSSREAGAS